jgi:two-component system, cell cycle sensor histidine kinase and response regulator CckA
MDGGRQLQVIEPATSTCGLLDRYRELLVDERACDEASLPNFGRKVQQVLCKEARCLGAIGTYISGPDDADVVIWSRECAEIFELTAVATPRVSSYFDRVHADDVSTLRRARREAVEHGGPYDAKFRIRLASGELRWVHERGAAIELERQQGHRLVGVLQDITEQQEKELALRACLSDTEDQLRHAQRMESLGRLASGVAHDFNNLLSVIITAAELALSSVEAGTSPREDLAEIHKAGVRGALLTRQLLAFSRRGVTQPQVLEVQSLFDGMRSLLHRVLGEGILLRTTVAKTALRVRADAGMLEQVIMNLAINARDAMPGGGSLNIDIREMPDRSDDDRPSVGAKVCIEVTDTGTGIDETTLARVFEPFFTTKEAGRGTGLGLSTVLGIIQQCGGCISVKSELGRGTSFTILLPRVEAEIELAAPALASQRPSGTETILLVEDEEQVREIASSVLRKSGYTVIEASNGVEALTCLGDSLAAVQLLVTDIVMPRMGGGELARRLWYQRPELKVLFISGYERCDAGATADADPRGSVLHKPFGAQRLAQRVREALEPSGARSGC